MNFIEKNEMSMHSFKSVRYNIRIYRLKRLEAFNDSVEDAVYYAFICLFI